MNIANRITLWTVLASLVVLLPMSCFSYRATWQALRKQFEIIRPMFTENIESGIGRHNAIIETVTQMGAFEILAGHVRAPSEISDFFSLCIDGNQSIFGMFLILAPDRPDGLEGAWYLYRSLDYGGYDGYGDSGISLIDLLAPEPEDVDYRGYGGYEDESISPGRDRSRFLRNSVEIIYQRKDELSFQEQDWYAVPAETKSPFWSKPFRGRISGVPLVTYSIPLLNEEGRFLGIIACDVSLNWLNEVIAQYKLPRSDVGQIFLLAGDGTVLADKYWGMLYRNIFDVARYREDEDLAKIARQMLSRQHGEFDYRSPDRGSKGKIIFMPIDDFDGDGVPDWSLGIFVPYQAMRDYAFSVSRSLILIELLGMFFLLCAFRAVARGISKPIQELHEAALTIASGHLDAKIPVMKYPDEVSALADSFEHMQHELKTHIDSLAEATRLRERVEGEMRVARKIQMSLVPTRLPETPLHGHFDLAAFMEPARSVGGDFYDYFLVDGETLCLVVADVSGKGVPASLLMARCSALFRGALSNSGRLETALRQTNRELCDGNEACMFVTLFAMNVHLPSGECRFVNAGHNPPVLLRRNERAEMFTFATNLPLGIDGSGEYLESTVRLNDGDLLFLYTDGVTEAINSRSVIFGEDRMLAALSEKREGTGDEILESLRNAIRGFVGDTPQSDDITMLALRYFAPTDRGSS